MTEIIPTDLAETALAFCRECLGWEQCRDYFDCSVCSVQRTTGEQFRYHDLAAVMEAVTSWCREHSMLIEIVYMEEGDGRPWAVSFPSAAPAYGASGDNLCHTILAACVEANRKLKGTPDD